MMNWLLNLFFGAKVRELKEIEEKLNKKLEEPATVYTTVKSYRGIDREYYNWVCDLLSRQEYRYFLFDIRENIIRSMSNVDDKDSIIKHLGRIDMINIMDNYLKRYKTEYEKAVRRDKP